jgi:hypothetical protein
MRNDMSTKKASKKPAPDEMRPEYDLRGGVRGKYFAEYQKGTNVVLLAPDVAKSFRTSEAVNEALRKVISERRVTQKSSKRRAG